MEENKKKFALIGAAGFITPRHLFAIKDTGNELTTAYDLFDNVGILDSCFPNALFFTKERAFRKQLFTSPVDYVTVCTPNYLHENHIRCGLGAGADVICEKPLVLHPKQIDALLRTEKETGRKVYNILQLRLHQAIVSLKRKVEEGPPDKVYDIDLVYMTARGNWYYASWKGNERKSGGVATNIGIHFYDMLSWIFGGVKQNVVHIRSHDRVAGYLAFERARVRYFLSIDYDTIPAEIKAAGKRTYRSISMENTEVEFSEGFTDLHTQSYRDILAGKGFRLEEARNCIQIVHDIRHAAPVGLKGDYHPLIHRTSP
jgi:UDP-N-acetyl-2-amino-2-deoxyglucuronate dehydrogenase